MTDHPAEAFDDHRPANPALSPLSIRRAIAKRKARIFLVALVCAAILGGVVHALPATYLAESVVLIDTQKIPEKFVSATVSSDLEDRIEAIRQMLLSGPQLKKVIEDFGLYKEERKSHFEEEILEMMRKDISITLQPVGGTGGGSNRDKRTAAFRIGFQGSNPVLVMRVANRLTDLYVEQNLKTREEQASGTSEFIDSQLSEAKKELDKLEASVSAYKLQHNGELPQQEQALGNTLSRLQTELEMNRDAMNRAQQTRVILEGNMSAMEVNLAAQTRVWEQAHPKPPAEGSDAEAPGGPQNGPAPKKASQVLQDQLALALARYGEAHPDVMALRADLEKVKAVESQHEADKSEPQSKIERPAALTTKSPLTIAEPVEFTHTREQLAQLKAQIMGAEKEIENRNAEQQRILGDLNEYQRRVERLPVREQEMAQITRDYEISKANYKSLLDKKMAAEMALDMERRQQSERFTVVDRAQIPQMPIKPKKPLLYAAAGVVGFLFGLLAGVGAEMRRNVFLGEWELPAGTPVLARLPHIDAGALGKRKKTAARRAWFGRKRALANASMASVLLAGTVWAAWLADRL